MNKRTDCGTRNIETGCSSDLDGIDPALLQANNQVLQKTNSSQDDADFRVDVIAESEISKSKAIKRYLYALAILVEEQIEKEQFRSRLGN